jgi:hypothetical protein
MDKHTHASIRPAKERIEDELLRRPGVTGVDISSKKKDGVDTGELAIVVYVKKKKPASALKANELVPPQVEGVPTDVVEEEIVPHRGAASPVLTPMVDASAYPTLQGGISIGPCRSVHLDPPDVPASGNYVFVGTLGVMVRDRATGAAMALTNFHVACVDSGWSVGDTMAQPSRVDGGSCPSARFGTLTRAALSNHVDGAVITVDAGRASSCSITGIGSVRGTAAATVGLAVRKRGRTTELTHGTVTSVDYTTSIDYGDGLGVRTLRNQIRIAVDTAHSTQFGDHGDSGSVVVNADRRVVGLYFGGNAAGTVGVANPIAFVLDELGVDLCTSFSLVTSPIVCDPILTRPVVCQVVTRSVVCSVVTRPIICEIVAQPPVITQACPPVSLACGPQFPGNPVFPGNPGNPGLPGITGPSSGPAGDPTAAYGAVSAEDSYWLGYYTALEATAQAQAQADSGD